MLALLAPVAAHALCGDANGDAFVNSSDALGALETGIGAGECPACVCDVDQLGGIVATDALLILKFGVGQNVVLVCIECPNPFAGAYTGTYEGMVNPIGQVTGVLDFLVDDAGAFTGNGESASGQTTFEFEGTLEPDGSFESGGTFGTNVLIDATFVGQFDEDGASGTWSFDEAVGSGTWQASRVVP
jgi:hypothetical protein